MPSRRDTRKIPVNPNTIGRFLTVEAVAGELGVAIGQAHALVRTGVLPGIKIGGRGVWRIERSALEAYITEAYRLTEQHVADHPLNP